MNGRLVCDASAVIAALTQRGQQAARVAGLLADAHLAAPAVLPFECANVIRRLELAHILAPGEAAQAHADLLDLVVEYWPHESTAARSWELRRNLTGYDAPYVALAELVGAPLLTLDLRIVRAPGTRCSFVELGRA